MLNKNNSAMLICLMLFLGCEKNNSSLEESKCVDIINPKECLQKACVHTGEKCEDKIDGKLCSDFSSSSFQCNSFVLSDGNKCEHRASECRQKEQEMPGILLAVSEAILQNKKNELEKLLENPEIQKLLPKSINNIDNAAGLLLWVLRQNDTKLLRHLLNMNYADLHQAAMIGKSLDDQDMYAWPILSLLGELEKPGVKDVVKEFFIFRLPPTEMFKNDARRVIGVAGELAKIYDKSFNIINHAMIPENLKMAQKFALEIDKLENLLNEPESFAEKINEILNKKKFQ